MSVGLLVRGEPASAAVVRRELGADLVARRVHPDSVYDIVLVASELVGNAIRHGGAEDISVSWEFDAAVVTVRVDDHTRAHPHAQVAAPADTQGRGLFIVDALAEAWGVTDTDAGREVWGRVPWRPS